MLLSCLSRQIWFWQGKNDGEGGEEGRGRDEWGWKARGRRVEKGVSASGRKKN
jgi:hypothetical protein